MKNPLRGEAELDAGELGRFTIVFNVSALAELQSAWGLATGADGDLKFLDRLFYLPAALYYDLRLALFYGLQAKHRDYVKTPVGAGALIEAAGIVAARKAIVEALVAGFPEHVKDGSTPPKAPSPGAGPE